MSTTARDTGHLIRPCTRCGTVYVAERYFEQHCDATPRRTCVREPSKRTGTQAQLILAAFEGDTTIAQLSQRCGLSMTIVGPVLGRLMIAGRIERLERGIYRKLTP